MSTAAETDARAALRARQGPGARYDAPAAPADDLALARRGTAYFARVLNDLPDAAFTAPSLVSGWSRAQVIAHVGYQARDLAGLVAAVRAGTEDAAAADLSQAARIDLAASLPPRALRNLFRHAAVHLDVEWRDLADAGWDAAARDTDGAPLPVRSTPWIRARTVWLSAIDLDAGGAFADLPPAMLDRLLAELAPRAGGTVSLVATDRPAAPARSGPVVSGRTADLVRWLAGRGARRLSGAPSLVPGPGRGSRMRPH